MLLSIKVELLPNNKQITQFRKACGVARHAYNWVALGKFNRAAFQIKK
ncbi:MAG: helix-turn-helix domain-containing protein [Mastigocoleus sp.]